MESPKRRKNSRSKQKGGVQPYRKASWMASVEGGSFFHFNVQTTAPASNNNGCTGTEKNKSNADNLTTQNNKNFLNDDNSSPTATEKNRSTNNLNLSRPRSHSDPRQLRKSDHGKGNTSRVNGNMQNYLFHMRIQQKKPRNRRSSKHKVNIPARTVATGETPQSRDLSPNAHLSAGSFTGPGSPVGSFSPSFSEEDSQPFSFPYDTGNAWTLGDAPPAYDPVIYDPTQACVDSSPSSPSVFANIFDTPPESPESASFGAFDPFSDTSSYISSPTTSSPMPEFSGLSLSATTTPDASPISPQLPLEQQFEPDQGESPVQVENLMISGEQIAECDAVSQLDVQNSIKAVVDREFSRAIIDDIGHSLSNIGFSYEQLELTFWGFNRPVILTNHDCVILWTNQDFDNMVACSRYAYVGCGTELEHHSEPIRTIMSQVIQCTRDGSGSGKVALQNGRVLFLQREGMENRDGSIGAWLWQFNG